MTSHQRVWLDVLEAVSPVGSDHRGTASGPTWSRRMRARAFASRYDSQVEAGAIPDPGSPLAAHWARLTSAGERRDLAFALCAAVRDAGSAGGHRSPRVPVQRAAIGQATGVIDDVLQRLTDDEPVRARGMARLRMLLADARGPMYRAGRGTLTAAMRGVSAAI